MRQVKGSGPSSIFGYSFRDGSLLEEALTAPSHKISNPGARDNQRLEFLGDAVLGLLAADFLYREHPGDEEGPLTARRQKMVSSAALCAAAAKFPLATMLKRNKGAQPLSPSSKTCADAVEAVLGAAWLDGGLEAARTVFKALGLDGPVSGEDSNPKTVLQHAAQAMHPARMPSYKTTSSRGTPDSPVFTVRATVDGVGSATAEAGSIKEAETMAAAKLISVFFPQF